MVETPSSAAASRADTDSPQSKPKRLPDYLLAGSPKCLRLDAETDRRFSPSVPFREKATVESPPREKSARGRNATGQGDESPQH